MKVLLDTNIIIDYLQKREPFCFSVKQIIENSPEDLVDFFITSNMVTDINFIMLGYLTKQYPSQSRINKIRLLRTIMSNIFEIFEIINVNQKHCHNAINSSILDLEDAVEIEAAKDASIDYVITRNTKDFEHSSIPACSPEAFLKLLESENRKTA